MKPFSGISAKGVDCSTMTGKVLCGYQGWHAAEGDGSGRGWYHWTGRKGFKPGSTNVELWPDVSELDPDERYATAFTTADGKTAEVYSAFNVKTVKRHFQWMRDYGIDGVFVQCFAGEVANTPGCASSTRCSLTVAKAPTPTGEPTLSCTICRACVPAKWAR